MRSAFGIGASLLAGIAAVVASHDGDADIVPFFVGLTFIGGVGAWATHEPFESPRRRVAATLALVWLVAAAWVAVLLVMSVTVMQAASPPPSPEDTYLGLTATVYHAIGLFGGAVLIAIGAFAPDRWLQARGRLAPRSLPLLRP